MADVKFSDRAPMGGVKKTAEGYMIAEAFAVREGIQLYSGAEVGKPEKQIVRVYRPKDEVTHPDSMKTWPHTPITLGHPTQDVTPENVMQLARGEVSTEAEWKDGKIKLPLIIKDAAAIKAVETGQAAELSAGYSCQLDFVDGVAPNGEQYDAVQRNIRINHLALVPQGRAGSECRIGDSAAKWGASPIQDRQIEDTQMPNETKAIVLGDKALNVPVDIAPDIQAFNDSMKAQLAAKDTAHAQAIAAKDAEIATLKAERDAEKAKVLTDAQLDAKVAERASLISRAKQLHPTVTVDGKTNAEIRQQVVESKLGDSAKNQAEAYYIAAFDILAKDVKANDSFANSLSGFSQQSQAGGNVVNMDALAKAAREADEKRRKALGDAWNPNAGQTVNKQ